MRQGGSEGRRQRGFTMIVILGVLAAVALPRFVDLRGNAEKAALSAWVGALRSAYGLAFAASQLHNGGYTSSYQMQLFNITRCDNIDQMIDRDPPWMGHHIALGALRESVFGDPNETACSGNTIQFTTATSRVVTITNTGTGIMWSAVPVY